MPRGRQLRYKGLRQYADRFVAIGAGDIVVSDGAHQGSGRAVHADASRSENFAQLGRGKTGLTDVEYNDVVCTFEGSRFTPGISAIREARWRALA